MKSNFSLKNCIVSLNPKLPSGKPTSFVMKGAVGPLQSWVENYLQSHSPGEGCHNVSMSYDQWSWHHGSFWGEISFSRSDPGWSRSISNRTCSCAKIRCVTSLPYLKTRFSSGVLHPGSLWGKEEWGCQKYCLWSFWFEYFMFLPGKGGCLLWWFFSEQILKSTPRSRP